MILFLEHLPEIANIDHLTRRMPVEGEIINVYDVFEI